MSALKTSHLTPTAAGEPVRTPQKTSAQVTEPVPARAASTTDRERGTGHLDAELGLLRRAYSQLHANQPGEAQALLDEHAQRFPHGALEESREVARMLVLCKLGRERAARVRAEDFLATRPKSPFVERVRSMAQCRATE